MPHITIKMLKGRNDAQKNIAAQKVAEALTAAIGCTEEHISVAVEDFSPQEWQDVFKNEVAENPHIYKKSNYNPKDLL
ncbi:MAG: tautomerase family protein [Oscillospiraceae bacterium]